MASKKKQPAPSSKFEKFGSGGNRPFSRPGARISGVHMLAELLRQLPDDEVFSCDEIHDKLNLPSIITGRVRDWVKTFPGHYIILGRGMIIGTKTAIDEFCKYHSIQNPWQK